MLVLCAALSSVGATSERTVGLFLNEAGSFDGYTLFAPLRYDTTYLIDNDGSLIHSWGTGAGFSAYLLDDGSLIRSSNFGPNPSFSGATGFGGLGGVRQFAWDGTPVWEFEYSTADYMSHHDLEVLPNGNVLIIAWEHKTDVEAIAAGRNPDLLKDGELWPGHIIEVEPTGATGGNIVGEWHAVDHLIQDFDPTKDNYGVVADHPELIDINFGQPFTSRPADWLHANSIDYNPEFDQIVLSLRQFSELWVIDHSTTTAQAAGHSEGSSGKGGDLLYRWGNPQAYRAGDGSEQKLFVQHDAQWIEPGLPGEGNILVFNNGDGRPEGNYSSVEEIVPPVDSFGSYSLTPGQAYGPQEPEWTYANPPDFYSGFISGLGRLPNGNTLINSGAQGTFFEVTPEGETVWRYVNPVVVDGPLAQGESIPVFENIVFRAYRYAPDFAGLAGQDLTPGGPIEIVDTDGDGLTDWSEVNNHGTDPVLPDSDLDGCADGAELESNSEAGKGGGRNPLSHWDFMDMWVNKDKDKVVNIIDLSALVQRLFTAGDPNGDPLDPPQALTGYHTSADRSAPIGPNLWNAGPPDGNINIIEIGLAVVQFGHDCSGSP